MSNAESNNRNNINIEVLKKAHARLKEFMKNSKSEQEQAGIIQAFEYCYELSWKIMKKVLHNEGLEVSTPKQVFREAGSAKIIEDVELWIEFANKRNLTVHTYNEIILKKVMKIVPEFEEEVGKLIKIIEKISSSIVSRRTGNVPKKEIKLNTKDFEILKEILSKYPYRFYVYGSRVWGDARKYSDLDIYCKEKMRDGDLMNLKFDLEDSDIAIKVDVLDPSVCSKEFREIVERDLVEIGGGEEEKEGKKEGE
jgi:nucleotidyltransferase substrate binding protein (TIGR01987 family)